MTTDDAKLELRQARAARARAARAFADLSQAAVAEALGVSHITVKRMERAAKDISLDELHAIADACHVPHEFMDLGFRTVPDEVRALHGRFDQLATVLGLTAAQAIAQSAIEVLRSSENGENGVA